MAHKHFKIDINGGDGVTATDNLYFKIYNASGGALLHTTGTVAEDDDVIADGDTISILNVDIGTSTSWTITTFGALESPASAPKSEDAPAGYTEITAGFSGEDARFIPPYGITGFNGCLIGSNDTGKIICQYPGFKAGFKTIYDFVPGKTYKLRCDIISVTGTITQVLAYEQWGTLTATFPMTPSSPPIYGAEMTFPGDVSNGTGEGVFQCDGATGDTMIVENVRLFESI